MAAIAALLILSVCVVGAMLTLQFEQRSISWNLHEGATLDAVDWPRNVMEEEDALILIKKERRLSIVLPSGVTYSGIAQRIYLGRRGEQLHYIISQGLNQTLDQAVSEAQATAFSLGIEATEIEEWYQRAKQNEGGAVAFSRQYYADAASFSIEILHSFDKRRPWFVAVEFYFPVQEEPDESLQFNGEIKGTEKGAF